MTFAVCVGMLYWTTCGASAQDWYRTAWSYRKSITFHANRVSGTLNQFPILIATTDADLASRARTNAQDLVFTASDGTTVLAHEIESYQAATGSLVAWVRIPELTSATNATVYLYYGNASATDRQNPTGVWDTNYVGVWHLKEDPTGADPQITDSTSSSNDGRVVGTLTATNQLAGKIGGALFFGGVDTYATIPNDSSLDLGSQGSIEAWFKLGGTGTWRALVTRGEENTYESHSYFMDFNPSNYLEFGIADGTHADQYSSSFRVTDTSSFHHLLMSWDGSHLKLYYDGVLRETKTQTRAAGGFEAPVSIGQWGSGDDRFLGIIDEVRISRVARSAQWIATAYNNQNSPATFHTLGSEENQTHPHWVFTSVANGGSPQAGSPFQVQLQAQTLSGTPFSATQTTSVQLSVGSGNGSLGGTLSGILAAGESSLTITSATYSKAESGIVLTATTTGGHAITAADSSSFTVLAGAVSAGSSTLVTSAPVVEANGYATATLTATLLDAYSNPVAGKVVSLDDGAASTWISVPSGVSAADGTVRFTVHHLSAETVVYTATDVSDGIGITPTVSVTFQHTPWFNSSWLYRKRIEIDHASVASTLTNFPLLVSRVDSELGIVAQTNAADLVFTSSDGVTSLAHEIESYAASNGNLVAWVNAPHLSATTNTILFLYYGNTNAIGPQLPTQVWDNDFVGVWHLRDDPSGVAPQIADSTAFHNDGTSWGYMQSSNRLSGQVNGALTFDGDNDRILVPATTSLELTNQGCVEAWFKPANPGTWRSLFAKGSVDSVQDHSYMIELDTSDSVTYGLGDGTDYALYTSAFALTNTAAFHHLLMSWDGARIRLYYNGELRESHVQTINPNANGAPLALGQWGTIYDRFAGILDELRVSKTARSAAWIATSYANTSDPSSFVDLSTAESPALPTLVIASIAEGNAPSAGFPFTVQVDALTASGMAYPVAQDTTITLSLRSGDGALGGTLSGTLLAGSHSVTISGVTYSSAESNVILTATATSGQSLTAADSAPFVTAPGEVSATASSVEATHSWVEADGYSAGVVVVTLRDALGNGVSGKTVTLDDGGANATITPASGISDDVGSVTFEVRDDVAETVTFSATDATDARPLVPTASITFGETPWYNASWTYRRVLTVDASQVADNLEDFPLLVQLTDSSLVTSARADGADFLFTSTDGTNQLAHEIESYVSTNGTLVAWVRIPSLSSVTNTRLFLYHGNPGAADQQTVTNVWNSSFAAVWHAKDASGEVLTDSTSHAGSASLTPNLDWDAEGPIGTALGFDGDTDYGEVAHSSALSISGTNLTISAWARIEDATGSDMVIVGKFAGETFTHPWHQYGLEFDTDGDQFDLYLNTDSGLVVNHVPTPLNQWVHIVYTYDGTATRGYLNGSLIAEEPLTSPIVGATRDLRIGHDQSYSQPFKGGLDELRIANQARSAAWVLTEYRNQSSPAAFTACLAATEQSQDRLAITAVNSGADA
ncbi:MAG: DUF2341 domain-containing protein, partial [Verrucomicrobiales bacterium]|nr:DUF2341 domain-containing protein [Verrucomicrobiales bacterium]